MTEGGAAAVEAGGKAWDEKDKVMDGAELGFKMAGPVLKCAALSPLEPDPEKA